ncbi:MULTISPECIES: aldehyde dehydrogenase [Chelativorans]|jgi:aldehyde dehydrogenase (NAD+)|uniref:Aldehyde dehydrogenase n=1 Tax=Chelativorans sp. (strain BNC1) TaxID=266779 RepID=Q11K71_CHESB|nr:MULTISPECIES: aldehyde dehydrogenase [Chelativorans]
MELQDYAQHIGGEAVAAADGETYITHNPANGRPWGRFPAGKSADVARAVAAAMEALRGSWGSMAPTRRGRLLIEWARAISVNAEKIARLETAQNGKIFRDCLNQARDLENWLYYYGGQADKIEGTVVPLLRQSILNYTLREPLGVIGIITPWNSPASLTMSSAAPALAAGNAIVIKPSEVTPASILEIARLAEEAGIPKGVINVVTGGRNAGEALVDHPDIAKIAFTGSVEAGRAIAERAGKRLIGCTLELGGKSPNIVFPDADLARAEAGVLGGIFASTGQTCVAGSRAYVHESLFDSFVERLATRARQIVLGDPMDPRTQMGPVSTELQLQKDERLVAEALSEGAVKIAGGERVSPPGCEDGYFYAPTVLTKLNPAASILKTEVFGPVLSVLPFKSEDDVVAMANDSPFGLAAGFWTRDFARAHRLARRLEAGTVWINMYRAFAFNSPMNGHKQSGIGWQNGSEAIFQYLKTKSVWCETDEDYGDMFARAQPASTGRE